MKRTALIFTMLLTGTAYAASIDMNAPKTITADKIEYNARDESIKTTGNTEIVNQSGQRVTLVDSYISKDGSALAGDDIKLWLGQHVYMESDDIVRQGDETIAHHALFTACKDCDSYGEAWSITSTTFIHDMTDHMMYFHNPVLWIVDIPVFWFPYYSMPDPSVKYKTGFLMPNLQSTNNMGTQINVPFYISISDRHDMTVTASYLTQENPLFKLEHRLNGNHSQYRTHGAYTHNKAGDNRWFLFNNDVIELGEYARATLFYERTSDKTFLQKYGFYDDQPYLDSGGSVELFGQTGYVVADAHIFQELRRSSKTHAVPSGNILPNIRGVYQTAPFYSETYATFSSDMLSISSSDSSSQRVIGDARITSPWTLWGGNRITASVSARYDVYNFDNTQMIDGAMYSGLKNRFLPSGYVEWGLPLFRPTSNWTQIIEPRARLTVMRHLDNEQFALNNDSAGAFLSDTTLFSLNRFAGLDLWENGTFADYGVRWATFNSTGHDIETFLGQTYDITDRADTDPNSGFHNGASDYVGRVRYNAPKWFSIASRFRVNRDDLSLRHVETTTRVGTSRNYINVGHIWSQRFIDAQTLDDNINEATFGTGIQLTQRLSVGFNAVYNITYSGFQRHSGGLFYNHPCYYMSLEYHRDNATKGDYVGNTTFQFRIGMSIDGKQY